MLPRIHVVYLSFTRATTDCKLSLILDCPFLSQLLVPRFHSSERGSFRRSSVDIHKYLHGGRHVTTGWTTSPAESSQWLFSAAGIKLIARSASAVIVRLGLTPRFAATTDPSQTYIFL